MDWNGTKIHSSIERESRRIRFHSENLTLAESDAFSHMLYELAWSISNTQPWPHGQNCHLSQECIDCIKQAAEMIESERRDLANATNSMFCGLVPITGGLVVAFPVKDAPQ